MGASARSSRNLCVAISGPSMRDALAALRAIQGRAEMVELRLDRIQRYDLERLLDARRCPAIVTLRPRRQGGAYSGGEGWRLAELRRAADLGAEWVDVELDAVRELGPVRARRIVSHHDFEGLPERLNEVMATLWNAGGEAAKLAAMVHTPAQVAPLLRLLAQAPRPSIVLGMGRAGVASRLLCLRYEACLLTYLAAGPERGTAPGQIDLEDAERVYRARSIGPATRAIGYVGLAEERDFLATVNAELAAAGRDAVCVPLGTARAEEGLQAAIDLRLDAALLPPALEAQMALLVPLTGDQAPKRQRANALLRKGDQLVGLWAQTVADQVRLLTP